MKLETADILDLRVPSDDGAVARALSNLETRLADWTACVQDLQSKLVDRAAGFTEANGVLDQRTEPAVAEDAMTPERTENPNSETETQSAAIEAEPVSPEAVEPIASEPVSVPDDETLMRSSDVETVDVLGPENELCDEQESTSKTGEGRGEESKDDETLLNSLPPDMANDIRVQYRFFNGRKSLQELIATYKAKPKNEKSSWWKRTKG